MNDLSSYSYDELKHTQDLISSYIHRTPVLSSSFFNSLVGAKIYFKCENFQKMGAFKMRGAANAIARLSDFQKSLGVVTHSSGNFAQAVALASQIAGIEAYIVMPQNAPRVKKNAVRGYGGHIIECESTAKAREELAAQVVREKQATFLHPSNNRDVIVGQSTAALELLEEHPDIDFILTPVGGGGLVAGTCLASHYSESTCRTIGVEPANMDDAFRSLQSGKIEFNPDGCTTIADGLRTFLGDINFPIIKKHIHTILRVEEADIVAAMRNVLERMKIIIEPSSAVPVAALTSNIELFRDKKIGVILSGGNVDVENLPFH